MPFKKKWHDFVPFKKKWHDFVPFKKKWHDFVPFKKFYNFLFLIFLKSLKSYYLFTEIVQSQKYKLYESIRKHMIKSIKCITYKKFLVSIMQKEVANI